MGDSRALDALIGGRMIASPNYSSRRGAKERLIVLHTTQGARTNASLGAWFGQRTAKCSSHVGIDDRDVTRFVPESYSAWTAGNANPVSTQAELCAWAEWSEAEWLRHPVMLELAARWVAAEAIYHGIPLVRVRGADTRTGSGVTMHVDCTRGFGGNHTDCGAAFSSVILDRIITRARQINSPAPVRILNALENIVADVNTPLIPSPIPGDKGKLVSVAELLQNIAANEHESTVRLRALDRDLRGHLAGPSDERPEGGPLMAAIVSALREGGAREAADAPTPTTVQDPA